MYIDHFKIILNYKFRFVEELCLIDNGKFVTYVRTARKMNFFESSKLAYGSDS